MSPKKVVKDTVVVEEEDQATKKVETYDDEDEFEEFELKDWAPQSAEAQDTAKWEDEWEATAWDDEDPNDDFIKVLKQQLSQYNK